MSAGIIGRVCQHRGAFLMSQLRPGALSTKWLTTTTVARNTGHAAEEDFWDKNKRLNRPMSPHMTIYKPQITTILSITHRGTGLALSALASSFAIGMLSLPGSYPHYLQILQASGTGSALLFAAKFTLAFPFMFHFCNGLRHLAWDLGLGFSMKQVNSTGFTVIGLSVILGIAIAAM